MNKKYLLAVVAVLALGIFASFSSALICYQETANVSTACGGLDTGSYGFSNITNWSSTDNTYDGDWNTYGWVSVGPAREYFYINYTKPTGARNSSIWSVKERIGIAGCTIGVKNLTIPRSCWIYNESRLEVRISSDSGVGGADDYCYNGTWVLMNNTGCTNQWIYEEAMYWNVTMSQVYEEAYPNGSVLETHYGNFNVTLTFLDGENPFVYLWYNGTTYGASQIEKNDNNATYRVMLDIPLVSDASNETREFYWNITDSEENYNSTLNNHTAYRIYLNNCTDPAFNYTVNYTIRDEISNATVSSDLDSVWRFWASTGSGALYRNYSNGMDAQTFFEFCINPNWANLTASNDIYYSATDYEPREAHYINYNFDNDTEQVILYLLSSSNATTFQVTVRDYQYNYYDGVVVRTMRYTPSSDTYTVVESCLTDENGRCLTHLILEDVYYRFMVIDGTGTVLHTTDRTQAYCPETNAYDQCLMTIVVDTSVTRDHYLWDEVNGLSYSLTHSNVTNISSLTYSFVAGTVNYIRFRVSQGDTVICNTNQSAIAGVINCDLTGYGGTVTRQVFLSRSDDLAIYSDYLDLTELWREFGTNGLFWILIIAMSIAVALVATYSIITALVIMVGVLFVASITGLGGLGMAMSILMALIATLIIIKLRR